MDNTLDKNGNVEKGNIKGFILFYTLIVFSFITIGPWIFSSNWVSSNDFHSCIEIVGSFAAIVGGVACLIYFFGLSSRYFLIIGLGFFIAGSEDLIHGILSFNRLFQGTGVDFSRFIPGTYVSGRTVLAVMIIVAPLLEYVMGKTKNERREALIFSSLALVCGGGVTALASALPLPQFIYPEQLISRPVDFFSAVLFFIAFVLVLKRYLVKRDIFSGVLLASILLNLGGQVYMSFSKQLFDAFFDLAHHAKVFSYLMPILGVSMQGLEEMKKSHLELTEREQAEEALRESEARMRAIVDTAVDGIITIDERRIVQSFNSAASQIFGYAPDEVIGQNVNMLMPEPYHSKHDGYVGNYLRTGVKKVIGIGREVVGQRKDGTTFPMDLAVSEVQLGDRRLFTGTVRDITERKEIERMKNEFVSTVSHELRTPLTSIHGSLGLIIGGAAGELPAQAKGLLDIAYNNSDRLVRLINDILDIEKIESGKMEFHFAPLKLMPLVEEAIEDNRAYAEQFGVKFVLENTLPDVKVNADSDRLIQVFTNLLSNATKFSPSNGTVEISVSRHNKIIRVSITDRGPGIPEEFRSRIFQKFAQADSSDTRQKGGTGLGLSITKAIVEKHDGQIGFETETNVGTTFYFDLPEWVEPPSNQFEAES